MRGTGLRVRLLSAFVLVSVPPSLLLAFAVQHLTAQRLEHMAQSRLRSGLEAAVARVEQLQERAGLQVAALARDDLPAREREAIPMRDLAAELARPRDLPALEIIDEQGRILSSAHFKAGRGLRDRDGLFPGQPHLRVERVALQRAYGLEERLALTASAEGRWQGQPVTVRGGAFLDGAWLENLSNLMQIHLGLRDDVRGRWILPPESPLEEWVPGLTGQAGGLEVAPSAGAFLWTSHALHPSLRLVAAVARTEADIVASEVRRATAMITTVALVASLVAALALSARIAGPVARLSGGARRVAGGDLGVHVEESGPLEIRDLAASFNAMTAALRDSRARLLQSERVASWREMARRLAHELKNPLFPIQLSIETLRRRLARPESAGASFEELFRQASTTILEELHGLRRIIDAFSEFARMPRPAPEPTDLNGVVEQALALYRGPAERVSLQKELASDSPRLHADPGLLRRALGNLIKNALEAMPAGGVLHLSTWVQDGMACVKVADSGPGLTEEQRTRLFTPYYTTKPGGTGLGLAIVQGIVSDHGGQVEVHSEPDRGTAFTLRLPLRPAS